MYNIKTPRIPFENKDRKKDNIPSTPEHEAPPQLHSGSREVSLGQTELSGVIAGSDGKVHSPDHHES